MFIRTAAFPLLLLCLACAGESPNAEHETVSNELVPDAARAPSCDPASDDLTLPVGFCATVFAEDLGRSRHLAVTDDGIVYVSQHGRDSLDTLWPDLFTSEQSRDNPAEEFFKLTDGDDYMWPYCYWDTALDKKILAPNTVVTARKSVTAYGARHRGGLPRALGAERFTLLHRRAVSRALSRRRVHRISTDHGTERRFLKAATMSCSFPCLTARSPVIGKFSRMASRTKTRS